ncbi:hypothetical protein BBBOND_0208710 [Babesia bigemina]|uniref:Uncharacterized protein n=1 Tax=Babesia bigemina TaxID=5866 RepID=A0A061D6T3_BABBI|nr:hypothetical protein BBBOND_0208710 [Babesia bigemina]CDR95717.1 hypothetical protein BBBOND_0208710 [Babesia bigemina]|eukprot:XP_012767903.1 hypothetical protein BBBOND_0208710 [Babesia bigemina]
MLGIYFTIKHCNMFQNGIRSMIQCLMYFLAVHTKKGIRLGCGIERENKRRKRETDVYVVIDNSCEHLIKMSNRYCS